MLLKLLPYGTMLFMVCACVILHTAQGALNRIEDRLEIQNWFVMYARSVDKGDITLYNKLFTKDAYIDYTAFGGQKGTLEEASAFIQNTLFVIFAGRLHSVSNIYIEFISDTEAIVEAHLYNPMVLRFIKFPQPFFTCGGLYKHRMVKTNDPEYSWKSKHLEEEYVYWTIFHEVLYLIVILQVVFTGVYFRWFRAPAQKQQHSKRD